MTTNHTNSSDFDAYIDDMNRTFEFWGEVMNETWAETKKLAEKAGEK